MYNNNDNINLLSMKNSFEIRLPFFCGFYESPLYNSDTLYWETTEDDMEYWQALFEDETLTADDLDIDFPRFKEECAKAYMEAFFNDANCPNFIKNMEFSELVSPRFYNYETDKLYVNVEFEEDWRDKVKTFMEDNKEWLTERIREEWTSCDGFNSFMSNNYDVWYKEFQKDDVDERYVAAMIGYIMLLANDSIYNDLITDTLESFYIREYIINTKEEKEDNEG